MRQGEDLMKRVAAADPLPDAERLTAEERRDADAMLARLLVAPADAESVERRARRPRSRPRRWALAAAGTACIAAVAFAAVNLLDSDAPGPGIVERAVAAVTQEDSVYHVLQRKRGIGGDIPGPFYFESWHSSDGRIHEKVLADAGGQPGRLLEEVAGRRRPGRTSGPLLRYDPRQNKLYPSGFGTTSDADRLPTLDPYSDPGASLRTLQAEGLLRPAGTTTADGRRAYRLVSEPIRRDAGHIERFEYLVDADTYLPVTQRYSVRLASGRELGFVTEFLVYERLPLNSRSQAQLDLDPHPGATCAIGAGELRGKRRLGFPNPCPPSGEEGPAQAP